MGQHTVSLQLPVCGVTIPAIEAPVLEHGIHEVSRSQSHSSAHALGTVHVCCLVYSSSWLLHAAWYAIVIVHDRSQQPHYGLAMGLGDIDDKIKTPLFFAVVTGSDVVLSSLPCMAAHRLAH